MNQDRRDPFREILLGYCFVIFGIISALNVQTVIVSFGWLGRGGWSFASLLSDPSFDNIESWYFWAGILFFAVHVIFMGLFMHSYTHEKWKIKTRGRTVLEVLYLSWAGGFSVIALHGPRIILTYLAKIDPEYQLQKQFMNVTYHLDMSDWSLAGNFANLDQRIYDLANYGIVVILSYFAILFFLHYLRRWRLSDQ